jgi:hypothetical protein
MYFRKYGYRGLWRYAVNPAPEIGIDHDITDDKHFLLTKCFKELVYIDIFEHFQNLGIADKYNKMDDLKRIHIR